MSPVEYLDFEIEVGTGEGREYPVNVVRSPGGEARERFRFPFDELALESRLKDLQIALLRSGDVRRVALTQQEQTVQDFGRALFDTLMTGDIRSRYDVSQREAARQGKGLRIKLRIQPPELCNLPWEFLYDSRAGEYICLSTRTPVVRYIELAHVIQPLTVALPLRILGVIASPNELTGLDVQNEKHRVETALSDLVTRKQVQIIWLEHTTWRSLQRTMRSGPWHVLHFIGHGGFDHTVDEGLIALEDENGDMFRLRATQLARLLADHSTLRLAVLNSCEGAQGGNKDIFSSTASLLVRQGLSAVLAMQYEITDRAAIEFARGFYEALADGLPVDAATAEARKSVDLGVTHTIEWGTPVLFMRAPDGVLFKRMTREQARAETSARRIRQKAEDAAHQASLRQAEEEKRKAVEDGARQAARKRELEERRKAAEEAARLAARKRELEERRNAVEEAARLAALKQAEEERRRAAEYAERLVATKRAAEEERQRNLVTSDDELWGALSYVFAPIVGIIVMLMEDKKDRPFICYHAIQSIVVSIAFWILATILTTVTLGFGGLLVPLFWLVFLYWAYKAYQGEIIEIPVVTDFIKNQGWL